MDMRGESAFFAQVACIWEATARKVGNVHPSASFADLEYTDFLIGAARLGQAFASQNSSVGKLILSTIDPRASNANLGIILLLAPLHAANANARSSVLTTLRVVTFHHEERGEYTEASPGADLRADVAEVLQSLTQADAADAYEAIRLANPGGLGEVPNQDVHTEPTVTLLEAMQLAADRDLIARQYASGFADVFDFGLPILLESFSKFECMEAALISCQLRWMAEFPDSLIVRKNGQQLGEEVRNRAAEVGRLGGIATIAGRKAGVALDHYLRSDGNKLNPGTTADLIAACLFAALRTNKISTSAPFRWEVEDWL